VDQPDNRDVTTPTFTPTATPEPAEATLAAAQVACTNTTPILLDLELRALDIYVAPTCVTVDDYYWQLTDVRWLDEAESNGLHHIFVEVVDENNKPAVGAHVVMRWETGDCTREVRDANGINCAMFNAGTVYTVQVDDLPSEQATNLGLGTYDERQLGIKTSYRLTFQKTKRTGL